MSQVRIDVDSRGLIFTLPPEAAEPNSAFDKARHKDTDVKLGIVISKGFLEIEPALLLHTDNPLELQIISPVHTTGILRLITDNLPQVELAVLSPQDQVLARYPLAFTAGPAQALRDFIGLSDRFHQKKAKPLAIFTNVFNEGQMLAAWERHYAQYVDYADLYVIDDASTDQSIQLLNRRTNVVSLPKGEFDNWGLSNFCSHFQRFLLSKYQWVIHVDCDEFLIAKEGLGTKDFLGRLQANTIYQCDEALLVVHDVNQEPEFDFKFSPALTQQRQWFGPEIRGFLKPVLADRPTTWGPGYHYCFEDTQTLQDFWLIHLKYVDFNRLRYRNTHWGTLPTSALTDGYYRHVKELRDTPTNRIEEEVLEELRRMMPSEPFPLPAWVKEQI